MKVVSKSHRQLGFDGTRAPKGTGPVLNPSTKG
jgi:hypothetical protein